MFHALADAGRRSMVDRLSMGPASVKELARPLAMSLPAVLQHLKVLEDSGLVTSRKEGRVRMCALDKTAMRRAEDWFAGRRAMWEQHLDRLEAFLAETETKQGDQT